VSEKAGISMPGGTATAYEKIQATDGTERRTMVGRPGLTVWPRTFHCLIIPWISR